MNHISQVVISKIQEVMKHGYGEVLLTMHDHKITKMKKIEKVDLKNAV